jgi:hypothetical protein
MKYRILNENEILYDDLTEEEYFDKMQSLAEKFYQTGSPNSENLKTEIVTD